MGNHLLLTLGRYLKYRNDGLTQPFLLTGKSANVQLNDWSEVLIQFTLKMTFKIDHGADVENKLFTGVVLNPWLHQIATTLSEFHWRFGIFLDAIAKAKKLNCESIAQNLKEFLWLRVF